MTSVLIAVWLEAAYQRLKEIGYLGDRFQFFLFVEAHAWHYGWGSDEKPIGLLNAQE